MSHLKEHFNKAANDFDKSANNTIPKYNEMLDALINAIPDNKENPKILDLGCGTGNITLKILERFPNAEITCLDLSDKMIEIAKDKLKEYDNVNFIIGDFTEYKFEKTYDAIVSSLALHHIPTDEEKQSMYQDIYNALTINGVFYNADVTKAHSKYNEKLNNSIAIEYMIEHGVTKEDMQDHQQKRDSNDIPSTLVTYLTMLNNVGFKEIDVIWKYYSNSVYGGTRK